MKKLNEKAILFIASCYIFLNALLILTIFEYGKNVIFVRIKLRAEKTDEARKIISPVGQTANRVRDKKLLSQIHSYIHTCIADIKINKYVCACVCL